LKEDEIPTYSTGSIAIELSIEVIGEDTFTSGGGFLGDVDFATAGNPDIIEQSWKSRREAAPGPRMRTALSSLQ
jgi:hypothetical protein